MVKDTRPPLADEFSEVLRKTRLGVPLSEALDGLSLKIGSKDLRMAVISMNLAKEAGGNMGEILSRLTETMQERQKIKGKVMALTAQGRASGIVMSCIPFLLLGILYVMQPEIMGLLFTTLPGNIMLAVVILMVSAGVLVIDRIVKIDI
jgi:tight adherence protein B